jgi:hypothetical protein
MGNPLYDDAFRGVRVRGHTEFLLWLLSLLVVPAITRIEFGSARLD